MIALFIRASAGLISSSLLSAQSKSLRAAELLFQGVVTAQLGHTGAFDHPTDRLNLLDLVR